MRVPSGVFWWLEYLPQMSTNQTRMELLAHGETTSRIIGAAFEVHNILGYGFLEKVYQRAMQVELIKRGSSAEMETPIKVLYKNAVVGESYADLLVDGCVIVEIKVARCYNTEDEAQLLNELKATGTKVGMLVNFGRERVEYKRMVF
jgi:GxxExxY protein